MTSQQSEPGHTTSPSEQKVLSLYRQVVDQLPGAHEPAVREWRDVTLNRFSVVGLPNRRVEDWKYTDLRSMMPHMPPLTGLQDDGVPVLIDLPKMLGNGLNDLDAEKIVFVNGRYSQIYSSHIENIEGVSFHSLRNIMENQAMQASASTTPPLFPNDVIYMLAQSFATDGMILAVEPGIELDRPIHVIFVNTQTEPSSQAFHNTILVGKDAHITLIETHCSLVPTHHIGFAALSIDQGAVVQHIQTAFSRGDTRLTSTYAEINARAIYKPVNMTCHASLTRAQSTIKLKGENAECHYSGAMLLRDRDHADYTLVVDHVAESCMSRELVKAVLDDHSRGVFQGKVIVQRSAQKTDGKQMANALLLSDDAEFDSKPELEIYADDVVCGHGATTGQLDEDMMFYLQARGIPDDEARALLITAFVGEALDAIENESLKAALQEKIEGWLTQEPPQHDTVPH